MMLVEFRYDYEENASQNVQRFFFKFKRKYYENVNTNTVCEWILPIEEGLKQNIMK